MPLLLNVRLNITDVCVLYAFVGPKFVVMRSLELSRGFVCIMSRDEGS